MGPRDTFTTLRAVAHTKWTFAAMLVKTGCQWWIVLPILAGLALYFGLIDQDALGNLIEKVGNALRK